MIRFGRYGGGGSWTALFMFVTFFVIAFMVFQFYVSEHTKTTKRLDSLTRESFDYVSTSARVLKVEMGDGTDNNHDHIVDYFYVSVKTDSGSDPLPISHIMIDLTINSENYGYFSFDDTIDCTLNDAADPRSIYNETNAEKFGARFLHKSEYLEHNNSLYLHDSAELCFKSMKPVLEDTQMILRVLTKSGIEKTITKDLPTSFDNYRMTVYESPI